MSKTSIVVAYRNDLCAYLSDWENNMRAIHGIMTRRNPNESQRYLVYKRPPAIDSYSFNSIDFSILLRYLNDKLEILEQTPITREQFPYQAYADARVFLKAFFLFFRIILDDLSGIIGYFYKKNEKIALPDSFNGLVKKCEIGGLPKDLKYLIDPTISWFPGMRNTRDDLVHYFDSILLSFNKNQNGKNVVGYFNIKGRNSRDEQDIRRSIGLLLCGYQEFIDNLLDHFDAKFLDWYGMVRGKSSRTPSIIGDGIILWWAYKYGDYRNDNLQVSEKGN